MKLPTLPKMPKPRGPWLQIGPYYIGRFGAVDLWIEHESGEGMQVSNAVFQKLIDDFYKANF